MSEAPTPNENALIEAIEAHIAALEAMARVQEGLLKSFPARLTEAPARVCARCNRKLMPDLYNVRHGLYYHVTCTPTREAFSR